MAKVDHSLKKKLFSGSILLSYNLNVCIAFCKASAIFYLHTVIGMVGFVLFCCYSFFCLFSKGEHRRAHHVLRDAFSFWVICNVSSIYIFMKTKKQSFFKMKSFSLLIISLPE